MAYYFECLLAITQGTMATFWKGFFTRKTTKTVMTMSELSLCTPKGSKSKQKIDIHPIFLEVGDGQNK